MRFRNWLLKKEKVVKKFKDKVLEPVIRFLDYTNIPSLFVSILSLSLGLIAAISLIISKELFFGFMVGSLFFDFLDGGLVRFRRLIKRQRAGEGFWLDYSFDRIVVITVMAVLVFMAESYKIYYILALAAYILVNILFILFHKKFQIVYIRTFYFLLVLVNYFYATIFVIFMCIINLLNFGISILRKKPL